MSSLALAESAVAENLKTPFIAAKAGASGLTGRSCNLYTIRLQPPVAAQARRLLRTVRGSQRSGISFPPRLLMDKTSRGRSLNTQPSIRSR